MDSTVCSPLVENEPMEIDEAKIDSPDEYVATIPKNDNLPKPPISKLSKDILALIFKMIPIAQWLSLKIVSRQFRSAIRKAWKKLDKLPLDNFVFNDDMIAQNRSISLDRLLANFYGKSPNVTSISGFSAIVPMVLGYNGHGNFRMVSRTAQRLAAFKNLKSISFAGSYLLPETLIAFLKASASRSTLKHLDISNACAESCGNLSTVLKADGNLPEVKLETLVIETAQKKMPNGYGTIFLSLSLPWLTTLRASGSQIGCESLTRFLKISTQLKCLEFSLGHWQPGLMPNPLIYQQPLFDAIADMENLSILKISVFNFTHSLTSLTHCPEVEPALINLIISLGKRGKLTSFGLANWKNLSNEFSMALAGHMNDLTSLELSICRWESFSIDYLGTMARLEIHRLGHQFSTKLMNDAISEIGSNFVNLKCLHLVDSPESPRSESEIVKFEGLNSLLNLKELRIQDSRISDQVLVSWADRIAPNLEILELMGCKNLTVIGFIPLIQHMPQIRRLVITDTKIDDSVLPEIAAFCPKLEILELSMVMEPSSASIQSIIDQCPYLKEIRIKSDTWIYPNQLKFPKYRKILTKWKREI